MSTTVPVVLIGFNRPEHLRRTIAALRAVRPETVLVVLDGPRPGHPTDAARCAETRRAVDEIDWPCRVVRRESEANLGCEANVELGLDWAFSQVSEAVVLEDDCVPDATFFDYATELLDRYRDDPRVWQVAGNSHDVPASLFGGDSYRFSAWASVWGWATWADRWQQHRRTFPRDHVPRDGKTGHEPVRTTPAAPHPELLVTSSARRHFADAATSQDVVTHGWDKQWWLTMLSHGALAATPAHNHVENIGFGAEATHGVSERAMAPAVPVELPLRHPTQVRLDVEVERELELVLSRVGGRSAVLARTLVRSPRARALARRAVHSPLAVRFSRTVSRMTSRGAAASSAASSAATQETTDVPGEPRGPVETPVVLVVFNRPDVTRRSLAAVAAVRPSLLFVVADGPRAGHPTDAERCAEVRGLLEDVGWPCHVERKYAERNLGLEANVELGLDWVFSQVSEAIVLEDDCVPDPTFFDYAAELLERYRDDRRVWLVAGDDKQVPRRLFDGDSYALTSWASVWGWASWADRWHYHRALFDRTHDDAEQRVGMVPRTADAHRLQPALPAPGSLVTDAAVKHFSHVAGVTDGDQYGWDHHFWVTIMSEGGLCATPAYNVVENDGFGADATHTHSAHAPTASEPMPMPMHHPAQVRLNESVQAELELMLLRADGRLSRFVKRLIRPVWLRGLIGRVLYHPLVWPLTKRVVAR